MWRLLMKKIVQVLIICVMAVIFTVITFSLTIAAEKKMTPSKQMQEGVTVAPPATAMLCPSGWHKKMSNSEEFKCAPNKPSPMKCSEGWKYVEALDCKTYAGIESQTTCSGCEVGCVKIMIPK
jgi:hypothetical protein